ncbi:MAG: hypothetical protein WBM40_23485, partial [Thiohalocapsa sp.]
MSLTLLARISTKAIVCALSLMANASIIRGIILGPSFFSRSIAFCAAGELTSDWATSWLISWSARKPLRIA